MNYVALLRGVNVGGKHALPMAKVRATVEALGGQRVATYIQSGNVVFAAKPTQRAAKVTALATALAEVAGFAVPVVLRTAAEWSALIDANPYGTEHLHCAFLPAVPVGGALDKLAALDGDSYAPSRFAHRGREIYLDLPDGIGRAKLAAAVIRIVPDATVRNWRTVQQLAGMLAELA